MLNTSAPSEPSPRDHAPTPRVTPACNKASARQTSIPNRRRSLASCQPPRRTDAGCRQNRPGGRLDRPAAATEPQTGAVRLSAQSYTVLRRCHCGSQLRVPGNRNRAPTADAGLYGRGQVIRASIAIQISAFLTKMPDCPGRCAAGNIPSTVRAS
ncbi:hypothetical protein B0T16DRAFT_109990 [Cercophora newfieldiana]|uniref:Uncharacterized protein n=1 Tax=Cercophora newfieldiana TaxID=92897 RepID=A0AA40CWA4_9PEZI|nr:hypothetical protein B0T16DRAFT_109990 [Cercophora newfieldiana]